MGAQTVQLALDAIPVALVKREQAEHSCNRKGNPGHGNSRPQGTPPPFL
jgi:hypothetical protein